MNGTKNRQSVKGEPVLVRSYDPRWIRLGAAAVQQLREALPQTVAELRHIGSTSVRRARSLISPSVLQRKRTFLPLGSSCWRLGTKRLKKMKQSRCFLPIATARRGAYIWFCMREMHGMIF